MESFEKYEIWTDKFLLVHSNFSVQLAVNLKAVVSGNLIVTRGSRCSHSEGGESLRVLDEDEVVAINISFKK